MSSESLTELMNSLQPRLVNLAVPKFEFAFDAGDLIPQLTEMGLGRLFNMQDFSSIIGAGRQAAISDVVQRTYIKVDELGTKAAAVTAIVGAESAFRFPPDAVNFALDRPAMFFIYHTDSKVLLAAGRLTDPEPAR